MKRIDLLQYLNKLLELDTKFEQYIELYQHLNKHFGLTISNDAWRKRKKRDQRFEEIAAFLIDKNDDLAEEAYGDDDLFIYEGSTFKDLNPQAVIDKIKHSHNNIANSFKENILTINKAEDICLVIIGDTHIGKGLNINKLIHDIEIIANTPNMYVLLMGDYSDNFINGAWCMNMALVENVTPREQIKLTQYIFEHIKHKIIGMVLGNHDEWLSVGDWHPLYMILEQLEYSGFIGTNRLDIELRLNDISHKIRMMHNWPGRSINNPTYGIEKAIKQGPLFDIGIAAHTHEGALYREFDWGSKKRIAIKCGSYKHDDYAYKLGYSHNGSLNGEAAVPIIITTDGNYSNAPSLEYAAKLVGGEI